MKYGKTLWCAALLTVSTVTASYAGEPEDAGLSAAQSAVRDARDRTQAQDRQSTVGERTSRKPATNSAKDCARDCGSLTIGQSGSRQR